MSVNIQVSSHRNLDQEVDVQRTQVNSVRHLLLGCGGGVAMKRARGIKGDTGIYGWTNMIDGVAIC